MSNSCYTKKQFITIQVVIWLVTAGMIWLYQGSVLIPPVPMWAHFIPVIVPTVMLAVCWITALAIGWLWDRGQR